jgi:Fe-S-cluster-containing hydrogenase component 2
MERVYFKAAGYDDPARCTVCGECRRICPAGAISEARGQLRYDYERCLRCYCCVEVCPHGALRAETPPLGSVLRRGGILD